MNMQQKYAPASLEELKRIPTPRVNVNERQREELSPLDRLALWITEHVGTMGFFLAIFMWTVLWLSWNMFAPVGLRFDPAPAFVLWLFMSNMIQILLMPLIMVGQNLQSRHSELRAAADFEVNTKAEREIETIIMHLENQETLLREIAEKTSKAQS